jgi:hypothetical protein
MLGFLEFLSEAKKPSQAKSAKTLSDDKGKLHELLLAKHLNPSSKLPSHWRSKSEEYGGTPTQVHARLKKKVGAAAYKEIHDNAKNTASAVMEHLHENGHMKGHEITNIHWTSNRDSEHNPGDHERTTGVKDKNSNADLILTFGHKKTGNKKFIGISAKYGSQSKPNLKNSGLDSLEKESGVEKGSYTNLLNQHKAHVETLGYTGTSKQKHAQYKKDIAEREAHKEANGGKLEGFKSSSKKAAAALKRATDAEQSSHKVRTEMAGAHRTALSGKNDQELRDMIKKNASPKTVNPHIIAHTHVQSDGSAVPRISASENHADHHLNKFSNLHVEKGDVGIAVTIKGVAKEGKNAGKVVPVATQTFKAGSGPHKGVAGAFKL